MAIIRYTTPTIRFDFREIDVNDIVVAFLVVQQGGRTVIERDLTTATIVHTAVRDGTTGDNYISWTLTQEETKSLAKGSTDARVYCDWKLASGVRGRSKIGNEKVEDTGKQEVI